MRDMSMKKIQRIYLYAVDGAGDNNLIKGIDIVRGG
jgi:hypothetical protein